MVMGLASVTVPSTLMESVLGSKPHACILDASSMAQTLWGEENCKRAVSRGVPMGWETAPSSPSSRDERGDGRRPPLPSRLLTGAGEGADAALLGLSGQAPVLSQIACRL